MATNVIDPVQTSPEPIVTPRALSTPTVQTPSPSIADNPILGWSDQEIAKWAEDTDGTFDPMGTVLANEDFFNQNPDVKQKFVNAHGILADRSIVKQVKDIDVVEGAKAIPHMGVGLFEEGGALLEHTADANRIIGNPVPTPLQMLRAIPQFLGAVSDSQTDYKQAFKQAYGRELPDWLLKRLPGGAEMVRQTNQDHLRRAEETAAAWESAGTGFTDLERRALRAVFGKKWGDLSQEERDLRFEFDLQQKKGAGEILQGKGATFEALAPDIQKDAAGNVDPAAVERRAAGNPAVFYAFGGIGKGGGALLKGIVRQGGRVLGAGKIAQAEFAAQHLAQSQARLAQAEGSAAQAATAAGEAQGAASRLGTAEATAAAERATGEALTEQSMLNASRGVAGEAATQAARAEGAVNRSFAARHLRGAQQRLAQIRAKVSPTAATIGAKGETVARRATDVGVGSGITIAGAPVWLTGKAIDLIASFWKPLSVTRATRTGGGLATRVGRNMMKAGVDIAKGDTAQLGSFSRLTRDLAGVPGDVTLGAAKGFIPDAAFGVAIGDTPQELKHTPMFMSTLGALGGAKRGVGRTVAHQLFTPRDANVVRAEFEDYGKQNYGNFEALDKANTSSLLNEDPAVVRRLGAIRAFAGQFGGEVFYVKDPVMLRQALESMGISPERAQQFAEQPGVTFQRQGRDGNMHDVMIMTELSAGPHEAGHVMEFMLPAETVANLRAMAKEQFAGQWDAMGQEYVSNLLKRDLQPGENWRQELVRLSRGEEAPQGTDVLTESDNLLASEIIAENFDAVFKARGPELEAGNTLFHKFLMRMVRDMVPDTAFTTSEGQGVPVTPRSFEATREAARTAGTEAVRPRTVDSGDFLTGREIRQRGGSPTDNVVEPRGGTPGEPGAQPPVRPVNPPRGGLPRDAGERRGAVDEARRVAGEIRDPDQQQIAQNVANAIEGQEAVSITYRAAPGEPAGAPGSNRTQRRAIIEAFRQMPESARALWERTFFPERLTQTGRGTQVIGWSPEVYAANAQKLATVLTDLHNRGMDVSRLTPYEVDFARGTFTDAAWQQMFQDAQTFSSNQIGGRTGAGGELVVPRNAQEMGAFAPEVTGEALPLDQNVADFHNMLFNFRLPNTPRITGRRTPLNVLGQEVSQATQPGRVSPPVEPRAPYTGEQARALGIEGREIQEVNPLRGELEQAVRQAGVRGPSMIEVIQRLNMDRIADVQPAPGQAQFGRGNTLTLTAGFQARRRDASGERVDAMKETPRVGYGKHVWLDKDGHYFDAEGNHEAFAKKMTGKKGKQEAYDAMFDAGWLRVNAVPGIGIFAENRGAAYKGAQVKALEDFAFNAELPVMNKKGRVAINSTADFMKNTSGSVFFQAAKRKGGTKDFALKPASKGDRMSKAWILPNGEPVMLGGKWHHQYLGEKAADLATRFKMDAKALKGGETNSRVEALKKGAVRINYNTSTGNLVIEATKDGWKRNKAAIEMFALENIDKIDSVDISLFDRNVKKEVDYDSAQLFRYDGPDKLANFPMLFEDMRNSAVGGARGKIAGLFQAAKRDDVESIRAASVRVRDTGKQYEGFMHDMAAQAAFADGVGKELGYKTYDELVNSPRYNEFLDKLDDGYTTNQGRFVTRGEAVDIGQKAGQLDTRAQAKIAVREERFGEKTLDSSEVTPLRDQQIAAEAGGEVSGETLGRAHGDPTRSLFQARRRVKEGKLGADREEKLKGHIEKIRNGESEGVTLNSSGDTLTKYDGQPYDVVTLYSKNFDLSKVTPAEVAGVMKEWGDVLAKPDTAAGMFKFSENGKDMVSVDVNAIVPKEHRANTVKFLKANDQIAGFDLEDFSVFEAGGSGKNPRITSPAEAASAVDALREGRDFFAEQKTPDVQPELAGVEPAKSAKPVRDAVMMPEEEVDASLPQGVGKGTRAQNVQEPITLEGKFDRPNTDAVGKRWNGYLQKVVDKVGAIPGFRDIKGTVEQRYNEMVRRIADNLKHLYELSPEADRKLHSQWYWFANAMSHRWAKEFGLKPRTVSAVNAILSPQKDWYENVSMTRRLLEIIKADPVIKEDHIAFTAPVLAKRQAGHAKAAGAKIMAELNASIGKRMSEVSPESAAAVARAENELFGDRKIYDHELNHVPKTEGGRKEFIWQGYETIADAIAVVRDPKLETINVRLGNKHKVRSFYNNHVNPQDAVARPVTVDTHATAAGALIPFGAASPEVKSVFNNPNNATEGYNGTYPLWADAYRLAAKELGLDYPLELQSITWERIRAIVNPGKKRSLQKVIKNNRGVTVDIKFPAIEEIWAKAEKGEITRQQAREQIIALLKEPTKAQQEKEAKLARNQLVFKLEE